ncbi:AAA family ATPase [Kribbella sp. NPDC056951]|uniref:AAA family ATPase n=1 Tax=Kribbella sp. NPDC056951 TaxID=3345978 RepID=UPI0036300AA4
MTIIDPGFTEVVRNHLIGNLAVRNTESPLILAIFGPPGEGKTFQTEAICADLGVRTFVISPGELESENAGHPGQIIRQQYLAAGNNQARSPGVLVINDVDTVLGDWGQLVQYTVNRQIVYGQLMALCDFPLEVAGMATRRVPIVLTGNDPSIIYPPLLRPGRARVFRWEPSVHQRLPVVASILPWLREPEAFGLLEEFPHQSISFWSDVRAALWEQGLGQWILAQSPDKLMALLRDRRILDLGAGRWTYHDIAATARRLDSDRTLTRSYLTESRSG